MDYPFRGEQITPGDFTLNPDGGYAYPPQEEFDLFYKRDDDAAAVPVADFAGFFYPRMIPDGDVDFGVCSWFVYAAPGTAATVRFTQGFTDGTLTGPFEWAASSTVTLGPGRTKVADLAPVFRDGPRLAAGGAVLRVEVRDGTLVLDTIELQLEPPGGLLVPAGWQWSDYAETGLVQADPVRRTELRWLSGAESGTGYDENPPVLSEINAASELAQAGAGETVGNAAVGIEQQPFSPNGLNGNLDLVDGAASTTQFYWHAQGPFGYGAACFRTANGATFHWTEYPADYHVGRPSVYFSMQPVEPPPSWELEPLEPGVLYEPDPDDAWETVGWVGAAQLTATWAQNYPTNQNYPPDMLTRTAFSVAPGGPVPWVEGVETPLPNALPAPALAPAPAPVWEPQYRFDGSLLGYRSVPADVAMPTAGSDVTVVAHGMLGELEDYPFGAGGSPGIAVTTGLLFRARLTLRPPRVRWRQVIWVPSPEAVTRRTRTRQLHRDSGGMTPARARGGGQRDAPGVPARAGGYT